MGASALRDQYKALWPPTEAEYQGLLDSVVFNDETLAANGMAVDVFTAGASLTHTRPNLEGMTIRAVKVGQGFLASTDYSLTDDQFTLTDNYDPGTTITVFYTE